MLEITTKINDTVKKHNMLSVGDTVAVGVSGGADSMLLLNYLLSVKNELSLNIIVANVEHGIRGEESLRDSKFVKEFCLKNDIRFEQLSINAVEEAKKHGQSVEEYSRNVRYDFFRSFNADRIATAHNLTDNVETVLFRLSRGTSIKGCCGIPPVRGNIIRPLIDCSADEIRQYCNEQGIEFVVDSTNSDNAYSRNFIRNEILPKFKELNPSFEQTVDRFIDSAIEDEECIDSLANDCFDESFNNNTLVIKKLKKYPLSVIKRTIVKYISLFDVGLDEYHLNGVTALLGKAGKFQIRGNLFAISNSKVIRVAVFEKNIEFDEVKITRKLISKAEFLNNYELIKKQFAFYCDYDKIIGNVSIRAREAGDDISPAGRDCTKSIKKLFNEYQIPVEDREDIPIIVDDKGIIGVYGYCCDERVKIDNTTDTVIMLNITFKD